MLAKFDEIPAMTLHNIKETQRYRWTDKLIRPRRHYLSIYIKAILDKNCLSSHSCNFVKNHFFRPNSFMHMFNVSTVTLNCDDKVSNC